MVGVEVRANSVNLHENVMNTGLTGVSIQNLQKCLDA